MYQENSKTCEEKTPELAAINNELSRQIDRMDGITSILKDRLNIIFNWNEPEDPIKGKQEDPRDILSEIKGKVERVRSLNDRLEHLTRHLNQIV